MDFSFNLEHFFISVAIFTEIAWTPSPFYGWCSLKGTLMQIWKSPSTFVFIQKQYAENFAFLILRIPELFPHEFRLIFI